MIYDLVLYRHHKKDLKVVKAVKILRSITDKNLKEAKYIIDSSNKSKYYFQTNSIKASELKEAITQLSDAGFMLAKKIGEKPTKVNQKDDTEELLVSLLRKCIDEKDYYTAHGLTNVLCTRTNLR